MAESPVHRLMKKVVRRELEIEGYAVIEEPLFPPGNRVSWSAYRPDLLGYRSRGGVEQLVLVECETRPNMRRFGLKNHQSVWFQPYIYREGSVRRILSIPQGRLRGVDLRLRRAWEIWVIGNRSPVSKIGVAEASQVNSNVG